MIEQVFNEYTSNFDFSNRFIKLKYNHSTRVKNLSVKYAKELGFNERDLYIAEFIGQFHDTGRFNQIKIYNTFHDSESLNHAEESLRVLFEEGLINKFDFTEEEKEIIRFAIYNHNRLNIDATDNERALMHAKLIRDTDKIDIIYLIGALEEDLIEYTNVSTPDNILTLFKEGKCLVSDSNLPNNQIYIYLAYGFDINYDVCKEEFINNLNQYYKLINMDGVFTEVYNYVLDYLNK